MKCCINSSVFPAGHLEHACVAGTLQMVSVLTHFHLTRNLWVRYSYQSHFTDEECQVLRG